MATVNFAQIDKFEDTITVSFGIEDEKILEIGEKINEINEEAYMNGYNWDVFFNYYLNKNEKDILKELQSDPEAEMYSVYFELNEENEKRATKFAEIIDDLLNNEEKLFEIIRNEGEEIEWD